MTILNILLVLICFTLVLIAYAFVIRSLKTFKEVKRTINTSLTESRIVVSVSEIPSNAKEGSIWLVTEPNPSDEKHSNNQIKNVSPPVHVFYVISDGKPKKL